MLLVKAELPEESVIPTATSVTPFPNDVEAQLENIDVKSADDGRVEAKSRVATFLNGATRMAREMTLCWRTDPQRTMLPYVVVVATREDVVGASMGSDVSRLHQFSTREPEMVID
ncbi:hypothetical protein BLNAU_24213 [Blattamonas nauphoetae]|uniref:Uncharacterized protein n=1 Tax=Blattamonas nauphoetae TaxID=2049346 RepID=A0ABQ9WN09_9EUKA|nr:hypothetical protein BLNAU_24213 [Blattamonas nauphoetae]